MRSLTFIVVVFFEFMILAIVMLLSLAVSSVATFAEELSGIYGPTGIYAARPAAPAAPVAKAAKVELPQQQAFEVIDGVRRHTSDQHLIDEHGAKTDQLKNMTQIEKNQLHYKLHQEQGKPLLSGPAPVYRYSTECNGRSCKRIRILNF